MQRDVGLSIPQVKAERPSGKQSGAKALTDAPNVVFKEVNKVFQTQLVPVSETVFVIPAKAGIQLFRSGPLLSQG